MTDINTANVNLKIAEGALALAQEEQQRAKAEVLARKAEASLRAATHDIWNVARESDWGAGVADLYSEAQKLHNLLASILFGAKERVALLNKLDSDRWPLDGEYKCDEYGYTKDSDVTHSVATWLFDCDITKNPKAADYIQKLHETEEVLGKDTANLAFNDYLDGRHDT